MRLNIDHTTAYRYDEPAAYSIQTLRVKPRSTGGQSVLKWALEVPPGSAITEAEDAYGNICHTLVLDRPHQEIEIRVRGEVETRVTDGVLGDVVESLSPRFFLRATPLTRLEDPLKELAELARPKKPTETLDAMHRLTGVVRDAIDYRIGTTHAATTAAEALAHGFGVCQDHAHVFSACARYLGIPARYVSGYLWAAADEADYEAGHAWAEAFVDGLGWVGFDVANRVCPTEAYVRTSIGLDYREAAPVRGMRRGGGEEALDVRLKVAQNQAQFQA